MAHASTAAATKPNNGGYLKETHVDVPAPGGPIRIIRMVCDGDALWVSFDSSSATRDSSLETKLFSSSTVASITGAIVSCCLRSATAIQRLGMKVN